MNKFKFLCSAGYKATLTIEASEGEAFVTLKTGLGHIVPPCPIKKSYRRGPSYQRRQERRQAARAAVAASSSQTTVQEGDENAIAEEASNVLGPAETDNGKNASEPADKAEDDFSCEVCDFRSNWANGLAIHMTRKHVNWNSWMEVVPCVKIQKKKKMRSTQEQTIIGRKEDLDLDIRHSLILLR